ncbi:fructose-bisphosphatase class III [Singulisphaera sp. Ch08]|uniref:Fructose-bisphosphatase class III n=1 Tax=Singulisphaera sp. Ch08 TaxID=3120278 RepID=A0AAU7CEM8_9BACT
MDPQAPIEHDVDGRCLRDYDLITLQALSGRFPDVDSATAEIARLAAVLTLPKGTVHVISDVHGEDKKLRHVINNASGTLRPLVQGLFAEKMTAEEFQEFLTLIFYPAEMVERLEQTLLAPEQLRSFCTRTLRHEFELVRVLAARYSLKQAMEVFPAEYRDLMAEMLHQPTTERDKTFVEAIVDELLRRGQALHLIHLTARLVRNLAISELIIGGDCWDRGPRGDRVVDYLRQQPKVSFIWGNHDVAWLGASFGHEALICHVLRLSLRYRRLGQLDEGYSIPLTPLEHLARTVYADDPASGFMPKASGMRPDQIVARMQKAAAVMQFKLEGQVIERNPHWQMEHRRLLHHIDQTEKSITVDGVRYPLKDTYLPTLDPAAPYELTEEEQLCIDRLRRSFLASQKLGEHMLYLVSHGSMYLVRDGCLIFHGCVPVDRDGQFLTMSIEGQHLGGRALFDAIGKAILRTADQRAVKDLDLLWYLWGGERSPLFGKDRITTMERDFIADKTTHHETKNPYFELIHEPWFCDRILREFNVDPKEALIVNGHVPVRIETGENPIKRSGKAITIDGAFSEAYGDHGYTLVLEADRTLLAEHSHFESVEAAVRDGVDIIPKVSVVRTWDRPHRVADTERGDQIRGEVRMLERLIEAYRNNELRQSGQRPWAPR